MQQAALGPAGHVPGDTWLLLQGRVQGGGRNLGTFISARRVGETQRLEQMVEEGHQGT